MLQALLRNSFTELRVPQECLWIRDQALDFGPGAGLGQEFLAHLSAESRGNQAAVNTPSRDFWRKLKCILVHPAKTT